MPRARHHQVADELIGVTRLQPRPELDSLFNALADAERTRLLEALWLGRCTARPLAVLPRWRRDEAAKQLKLLERAGLVESERVGRWVEHRRSSAALQAAASWVYGLRSSLVVAELEPPEPLTEAPWIALSAALRRKAGATCWNACAEVVPSPRTRRRAIVESARVSPQEGCDSWWRSGWWRSGLPTRHGATPQAATLSGVGECLRRQVAAAGKVKAEHLRYRTARLARSEG